MVVGGKKNVVNGIWRDCSYCQQQVFGAGDMALEERMSSALGKDIERTI